MQKIFKNDTVKTNRHTFPHTEKQTQAKEEKDL